MITRSSFLQTLEATRLVAVIRITEPADLVAVARALSRGGVRLVEITMTVPDALEVIRLATRQLRDEVLIGAGTVLDPITARLAIEAGAAFIVSPSFDPEVVQMAHLYDRAVMPGALTPTEIVAAWRAGADVVKVFPGRVGDPGYFADLKGPFPQIRLMPTGNVDRDTAPAYIRAGAVAVGIGKALVDSSAVRRRDMATITAAAEEFSRIVHEAQGANA